MNNCSDIPIMAVIVTQQSSLINIETIRSCQITNSLCLLVKNQVEKSFSLSSHKGLPLYNLLSVKKDIPTKTILLYFLYSLILKYLEPPHAPQIDCSNLFSRVHLLQLHMLYSCTQQHIFSRFLQINLILSMKGITDL